MNIDHMIGLVVGVAVAVIMLVPLCLLLIRRGRVFRAGLEAKRQTLQDELDEERNRTAELAKSVDVLNHKTEDIQKERDAAVQTNADLERGKLQWKRHYQDIFQKHNELVRQHNAVVEKYNRLLQAGKTQTVAHRLAESETKQRHELLVAKVQELQKQLAESQQERQQLVLACQSLRQQVESLDSDRKELRQKLATAGDQHQHVSSELSSAIEELHALNQRIASFLAEIECLQRQIDEKDQANSDLNLEISRVQLV